MRIQVVKALSLFFIMLGVSTVVHAATAVKSRLWKAGSDLQIHFLDGSDEQMAFIESVAQEWTRHANLKFIFHRQPPRMEEVSHIRIAIRDLGNHSRLGTEALNVPRFYPTIVLSVVDRKNVSDADKRRIVLHEFGHALGFIHEQLNPLFPYAWDIDSVLAWCRTQRPGWGESKCRLNVFSDISPRLLEYLPFDADSIMMYALPVEFTVERKSFLPTYQISPGDIELIRRLYP